MATLLAILMVSACAHRRPSEYARAEAAASRAYGHGRYDEAATLWLAAADAAERPRDADEAKYRAAQSLERGGKTRAAASAYDALAERGEGERAARAAFDRAELERADPARAAELRDRALRAYPSSGLAGRALQRQLDDYVARGGAAAALEYLDSLATDVGGSELEERLVYERAQLLVLAGDREAALGVYLETANRYPYPIGLLWDDSLYHAAELAVALGRPREAIAHLERMLAYREGKPLTGSVERPRFSAARYLIATTLRDELGEFGAARREFLRLVDEHPTSRLRDDALWAAAELALRLGDAGGACTDARRLARDFASSRYVGCLERVCPRLGTGSGRCPHYLTAEGSGRVAEE